MRFDTHLIHEDRTTLLGGDIALASHGHVQHECRAGSRACAMSERFLPLNHRGAEASEHWIRSHPSRPPRLETARAAWRRREPNAYEALTPTAATRPAPRTNWPQSPRMA